MTKISTLIVYAYTSFTSSLGVGPAIVKNFEGTCSCKVTLVNAGDAGEMINRLKLEGRKSKADVVVGLDGALKYKIKKDLMWDVKFVEFDQSPLSFVYNARQIKSPPQTMKHLLNSEWKNKIVVADPRYSTAGLNFLLWIIQTQGEEKTWDYLKEFKKNIKVVTPSWDLAYGLFTKNQASFVLSYWTSPAYHIQEENNENIKSAEFSEGHYLQKEYVFITPHVQNKKLADDFLEYLLKPEVQKLVMQKNFMYPAKIKLDLTPAFKKIGYPKKIISPVEDKVLESKLDEWLLKWRNLFI